MSRIEVAGDIYLRWPRPTQDLIMMMMIMMMTTILSRIPGFDRRSVHVRFLVDKVLLGQVCSKYFSYLLPLSFQHRCIPFRSYITDAVLTMLTIDSAIITGFNATCRPRVQQTLGMNLDHD
jgi:hypothetical protein